MKTQFGFEEIICEVPQSLVAVADLAHEAGLDELYIQRLHDNGLHRVPVSGTQPLSIFVQHAMKKLATAIPDLQQRAHGVIFCHSLPVIAPDGFPFLQNCCAELGLDHIPKVAVSGQPCSIIHMGIQLINAWLAQHNDGGIILIGADKVYSAEERIFFGSTMGDAVVAAFATRHSSQNCVVSSVSQCEVMAFQGEKSPPENIARFRQENPHRIRKAFYQCLADAGMKLSDLACIIPHTPYNLIWDLVAELLRYPREQILTDYLSDTGHMNSNDVFVHYERSVREGRITRGDTVMLVSPGFGGTRGCTLIRR